MKIPTDPYILLSLINTKLRDEYVDLDDLIASLGIDKETLISRLSSIGFTYDPNTNQFK